MLQYPPTFTGVHPKLLTLTALAAAAESGHPGSDQRPVLLPRLSWQAWSDGGYSDDLTVASKCTEQGLVIYCPSYAIFPQW